MRVANNSHGRSHCLLPRSPTRRRRGLTKARPVRGHPLTVSVALALMLSACGGSDSADANTQSLSSPTESSATVSGASDSSASPSAGTADCRDASRNCLGVLDPGTHKSTFLDVFNTGEPGQLTYTVGGGWANTLDHVPSYWIRPKADYLADDWDATTSGIYIWTNVAAAMQVNTCPEESDTTVDTSAASLTNWLTGLPGLTIVKRPSITIDGHRAFVLDVRIDGTEALCDQDAPLLANRPGAPDPWVNGIHTGEAHRLILFDLPDGHTAEVVVAGPEDQFKRLLARSRPVIASLQFAP